jgi:methionine biosynthesis protein MetW
MKNKILKMAFYYLKRSTQVFSLIFSSHPQRFSTLDYEKYWQARGEFGFSSRFAVFAGIIKEGASVLDIGCGEGSGLKWLEQAKGIKGEGVDISMKAVEMARAKGISAFQADVVSRDFVIEKTYDYIIISEVLEHVSCPEELMSKARHKFNKYLIVSLPNIGHYIHRLRLLFGRFPVQWTCHPAEHLRFWTIKDFKVWVRQQGYMVESMHTHTGVLFLHRIMPNLFADSVVFVLKEA